jgi:hypothetical protein
MRTPLVPVLTVLVGLSPLVLGCASGGNSPLSLETADAGGASSASGGGADGGSSGSGSSGSGSGGNASSSGGSSGSSGGASSSSSGSSSGSGAGGSSSSSSGAGVTDAGSSAAYPGYIAKYAGASAQYYVSPSGSDSNPGTQSEPWATLAHADSAAPGCSVIWFASGTYSASSGRLAHTSGSGTSACHRAFVSQSYGGAHLEAPNNTENGDTTWWSSGSYVDIVGFDISATSCVGVIADGTSETLAYNRVHDVDNASNSPACGNGTGGGGLTSTPGAGQNNLYYANIIWNIGQNQNRFVHGVYVAGPDQVVENNVIYNASGGCIQAYHSPQNIKIVNNTLVKCQNTGMWVGGAACSPGGIGSGYTIANNIIADSPDITGYAINEWCDSGSVTGWVITNNLVYGSGTVSNSYISGASSPLGTVTSSPAFVDEASPASGGDFQLNTGSPAVGAGVATDAPPLDMNGAARSNPPAIGAYE